MYLPSLVSGTLIARFGARPVMAVGLAAMAATVVTGSAGNAVGHYSLALVLLGIGWNFLYVGGTTLLVGSYRPAERFRAQGFNDACVFGTAALASLLGGALLLRLGWGGVLTLAVPVLVLMAGVLLASARTRVQSPA
jgi:MFS family permease